MQQQNTVGAHPARRQEIREGRLVETKYVRAGRFRWKVNVYSGGPPAIERRVPLGMTGRKV